MDDNDNTSGGRGTVEVFDDEPSMEIPGDLLVRLLHTFFEKDGTKITRDANAAVAKYMDVFVKEAIARTAVGRAGSFLEVSKKDRVGGWRGGGK